MKKLALLIGFVVVFCMSASALTTNEIDVAHAQIKARYLQYLKGTTNTFTGTLGTQVASSFVSMVNNYVNQARAFDFTQNTNAVFYLSPGDAGFDAEFSVYDPFLTHWLPAMAYAYTVNAPGNTNYLRSDVRDLYLKSLGYLNGRGVKAGMTFFDTTNNVPKNPPLAGCANVVGETLNMGSYCQSVLLMESAVSNDARFVDARELVRFMEMLGYSSGLTTYWIPAVNPPAYSNLVQSDGIQVYSDVTLVSAMLETNTARKGEMLSKAQAVFNDSLKVIPGWADTIKPDFTGYHHNCIYGNMYMSGFMAKSAFAVYALQGTPYFVEDASIENLKNLMLTYRLYAQKYDIPHGIRGRWPQASGTIKADPFGAYVTFASTNGIGDADMLPVFDRLWDSTEVGTDFILNGGRGKILQGLYETDMLKQLTARTLTPEPDPSGFWYKPYGGLALHRRDNWMAAVKGHSKYIWDYESGTQENEYGQYLSHGMLTIFAGGSPVSDLSSGYDVQHGWDWYRMPGTTAVHFPLAAKATIIHRSFPIEPFLGGVSADGQNGLFGMILSDTNFPGTNTTGGITINLKARKSVFFMDNLIVLLGTGISGGDGTNKVETTVFQTRRTSTSQKMQTNGIAFSDGSISITTHTNLTLRDPLGINGYYIRDAYGLNLYQGGQGSFQEDGVYSSTGIYSTVWFDHGLSPTGATYEIAVTVTNAATALAASPDSYYQVQRMDTNVHQVYFPQKSQTGYAFFNAVTNNALVAGVDDPCLVMTAATNDSLTIGVVNPNFARVADTQEVGMTFAGLATNAFLESQPQPVVVTLQGYWQLDSPVTGVEVLSVINNKTTVRFACLDGAVLTAIFITYDTTGFTTPGISAWTCPSNVISVQVDCWGGGGAGGSAKCTSGSTAQYGGGGAGGAYARYNSYAVTPGSTYYINVGAGGTNNSSINDTTVSGGDSWFNSTTNPSAIIIAKGGAGGQSSIGSSSSTAYGPGGTGTTSGCAGDVVYKGGNGFTAVSSKAGGGGSSGGTATNGTSATNQVGATAPAGGGNGGTGPTTSSANGGNGYSPGGGGSGARAATTTLRSGGMGSVGRVILSYTAVVPPGIATQPSNLVVTVGNTATFTVGATGTPLAYRWWFNATNDLLATNSTLVITNVQMSQAGDYTVVVTNTFGTVTSEVAVLTVNAQVPPSITNQPASQLVAVGHAATFIVGAAGSDPLAYRWWFNATNDLLATNSTLVVTNVQFSHAGNYTVLVTNRFGSVTSAVAVLTVDAAGVTAVNFDDTWNTNLNGGGITITGLSAAVGTNASVLFNLNSGGVSYMAGGLYNSFTATTLGSSVGDSITLRFTASFTTNTGSAVNLDRKYSFGLAGADDKLFGIVDTGTANGTALTFGGYVDTPNNVTAGTLYRGDLGAPVTNSGSTYTGTFTTGVGAALDTTYTLTLTRTSTGANFNLSQTKTNNNWNAVTRTFTTAEANAITLDKFFIGVNGGTTAGDYIFAVTNLSLTVNSAPVFHTLTVNGGTGDGSYTNGQQVAISADAPAAGKAFYRWTGDTQVVNDVTYTNALVTMSTNAVNLTATYVDVYYSLTVNSGTGGGGTHTNGTQVVIAADVISGKTFAAWTGDTQYVANSSSSNTTVTMPAQDMALTATYTDNTYALTVNGGTGGGSYTNGREVAISADAPAIGKVFSQWIGDTSYLANSDSASTTVTMPAQAITLTATYTDVYYALTVNSGGGDGSYTNGRQVAISADAPAIGKAFDKWIGDTQVVNDVTYTNALVTMSTNPVILTATYVDVYYALTVNSGTGGGSYTNGQQVAISADAPASGKVFDQWTGATQVVANANSASTTVTMPVQAINLTATYKNLSGSYAINFSSSWTTNYQTGVNGAPVTSLSGTGGTNASVSFQIDPVANSVSRGGVYNTFATTTLGTNAGDAITYKFTLAVYVQATGLATNTDRKVIFGVAGPDDKISISVDAGTAGGTKIASGVLIDSAAGYGVGAQGELFRTVSTGTTNGTVTGTYTFGPNETNDTTYTMVLKRLADSSATFEVKQEKPGNNWSAATQTLTQAQTDALSFDKVFIGWAGNVEVPNLQYTVTNLSLTVISGPAAVSYTLTVNSGTGGGSYTNGQQVGIAASNAPSGKVFSQWIGDTQYVASITASNTAVTMPAQAVTLTATYVDVYYTLMANGEIGGAVSPASTNVVYGGSATFIVTASNFYRIATLTTNGTAVTGMSFNNTSTATNFIWSNVQASGVLASTFTQQVTTNAPAQVPYEWLAQYGLTNSGVTFDQAAAADQDGDGLTAWQEYIAGTDPTNTTSVFKAAQVIRNTITWSAVTGRVYSVYWSTNLVKGFQPLETNLPYPRSSYTNATPDSRFNNYQIKVRLQ